MSNSASVVHVAIITAPDAACCISGTWATAVAFLRERLVRQFPGQVVVEHLQAGEGPLRGSSPTAEELAAGSALPVVLVDGVTLSRGGKLSGRLIGDAVRHAMSR